MNATPFVSIIIPAYNAALTLPEAIRSAIGQDFTDREIIIVDDCSTDATGRVAREFAASHTEIKVISKEKNEGYAAAVCTGIEAAKGKYVTFCDADDTMLPGGLSVLAKPALKFGHEMVIAPYVEHRGRQTHIVKPRSFLSLSDMPIDTVHFALWNKLLLRSAIIEHNCLPDKGYDRWADLALVARFMAFNPSVFFHETPVYNYFHGRTGSLTKSNKDLLLRDHIAIADSLIDRFRKDGIEEQHKEFIDHLKFCAKVKYARKPQRDLRQWARTYPEVNSRIMSLRHIPLAYRLLFAAAARFFSKKQP